jgi:general secretion pathway protein A
MYEDFFKLATSPFDLGPDPDRLYVTDAIREALATLAYGVNRRKGFILLTGDVGTGKTTILNLFMRWLQEREASTAFIFNPRLEPDDFLDLMMLDFGQERGVESKSQRMLRFNRWLLERYHAQTPVVLLVDEAQQLSEVVLEELRLLTNLETPMHKLLQIVLCGQPELNKVLARPSLRQLSQRITLRCSTAPFSAEQTAEYIIQRLRFSGDEGSNLFDPEAIGVIHRISAGIPRVINAICEQLLVEAYCEGQRTIDVRMVDKVGRERDLGVIFHDSDKDSLQGAPSPDVIYDESVAQHAMEGNS